jgi:hypothetical protein
MYSQHFMFFSPTRQYTIERKKENNISPKQRTRAKV